LGDFLVIFGGPWANFGGLWAILSQKRLITLLAPHHRFGWEVLVQGDQIRQSFAQWASFLLGALF
jgi:hypothetical protein